MVLKDTLKKLLNRMVEARQIQANRMLKDHHKIVEAPKKSPNNTKTDCNCSKSE